MATSLVWHDVPAPTTCRVCGFSGIGTLRSTLTGATPTPINAVLCPDCGSADLDTILNDLDVPDAAIDTYVENGVSIEAIGASLLAVDPATVKRFLDVGCSYGFGVHLARALLEWHAEGVEPGSPGIRGAKDLAITIHRGYLTSSSDFGQPFDLVLASEVLEHVDDPREFLTAIRSALSANGRVIITTPAAEILDSSSPESEVVVALSPGFHRFLSSADGLKRVLITAGFASVVVQRDGRTLRAVASVSRDDQLRWEDFEFADGALERYFDTTAIAAPAGSALESGMAARHFRALVNRGAFTEAAVSFRRAAAAIHARHQLDASDPHAASGAIRDGAAVAWNFIPVAYHAGMMKFLGEADLRGALQYFDLTLLAVRQWESQATTLDADSVDLRLNTLRHRALCIATVAPNLVSGALDELAMFDTPESVARWLARVFVQLVSQGSLMEAQVLAKEARASVEGILSGGIGGSVELGMDTLLCLATLELQVGSPIVASGIIESALTRLGRVPEESTTAGYVGRVRIDLQAQADRALTLAAELRWVDTESDVPDGVSVIMPVYNGARYLLGAVASVINQLSKPLELIIVDDGSTDGSLRLIAGLEADFPIVVIRQENAGQSAARNAGIRAAHGEYVAFLDQDDEWRQNHLSTLVPLLSADPACGLAFSDFDQMDEDGYTVTRAFIAEVGVVHPKRSLVSAISQDLLVLPSASVMRRRVVVDANGFDPRLIGYEDDDLFVKIYRAGWGHSFEPSSTVRYRVHVRGASATPAFLRSRLIFLDTLLSTIPDDHRIDFYLSHDVIIPRFYGATLRDYTDALAFRDWNRAVTTVAALRGISRKLNRLTWRRKLILKVMTHPRYLRGVLLGAERLPRWLRPKRMSGMYFGHRSVVRADRTEGRSRKARRTPPSP